MAGQALVVVVGRAAALGQAVVGRVAALVQVRDLGQVVALGQLEGQVEGQGPMAGVGAVVVVGQVAALGQVQGQVDLGPLVALRVGQQPAAWAAQAASALQLARGAQQQHLQRQGRRSRSPWVCAPSAVACSCCSVGRQRVVLASSGWCARQSCPAASSWRCHVLWRLLACQARSVGSVGTAKS
jgi:hypothetical protein